MPQSACYFRNNSLRNYKLTLHGLKCFGTKNITLVVTQLKLNYTSHCICMQGSKIAPARDTIGYIATNFVEVHGSKGWGLMCFDSIKPKVASVICRESSAYSVLLVRKKQ